MELEETKDVKTQPEAKTRKISSEMSVQEFERFLDIWGIDGNTDEMTIEQKDLFFSHRKRIIRAIESGHAVINDDETISYSLIKPVYNTTELKMKVPNGESFLEMDRFKENQGMHKAFALLAHSARKPVKIFSSMDGRDIQFFVAVSSLFLA